MSSDPSDEDEAPATVVAGASFDELLAQRGEPPVFTPSVGWGDDMAYAATAISASYDEQVRERGGELPASEPPPAYAPPPVAPRPEASRPQAAYAPPPAAPPMAFPPPAASPPLTSPAPHAPQGQPPLAKTMALDMSQSPLAYLAPPAQPAPGSWPSAPAASPMPARPAPGSWPSAPAASPMAAHPGPAWSPPAPVAAPAPSGQPSRFVLFAVTFGVVFLLGSLCFGGAAAYLLFAR
ncbi:MAG: hypothetical protein KF729_33225 [Sandaracinaceae bacterium]|nr:hypothetical protein [Sandaracinaceae bacterium]